MEHLWSTTVIYGAIYEQCTARTHARARTRTLFVCGFSFSVLCGVKCGTSVHQWRVRNGAFLNPESRRK